MFIGDRAPAPLTSITHQCDGVHQCLAERRDFESNGPQSRPPAQRPLLILARYSPKRPFSLASPATKTWRSVPTALRVIRR
jgi:hypothetical protein